MTTIVTKLQMIPHHHIVNIVPGIEMTVADIALLASAFLLGIMAGWVIVAMVYSKMARGSWL